MPGFSSCTRSHRRADTRVDTRCLCTQSGGNDFCIHVVQNDLLPLRMIVQAMFMHQLHARSAFNENSFQSNDVNKLNKHLPAAPNIPPGGIDINNIHENENGSVSAGYSLRRDEVSSEA